jgi:hypothetical protein
MKGNDRVQCTMFVISFSLFKKLYEFLHDDIHPSIGSVHLDRDELALKTFKATQTLETVSSFNPLFLVVWGCHFKIEINMLYFIILES